MQTIQCGTHAHFWEQPRHDLTEVFERDRYKLHYNT